MKEPLLTQNCLKVLNEFSPDQVILRETTARITTVYRPSRNPVLVEAESVVESGHRSREPTSEAGNPKSYIAITPEGTQLPCAP